MVLYRILGVTEIMRGSTISGIVAVVSESGRCNIARSMFEAAVGQCPRKSLGDEVRGRAVEVGWKL
jgi:hypothetical protein